MDLLSNHFYQALFEQSATPIAILKADAPNFTIVATNNKYNHTTRRIGEQLIGKGAFEVFFDKQALGSAHKIALLTKSLMQCIETKTLVRPPVLHFETVMPDGETLHQSFWQIEISPVHGDNGEVEYLMCATNNVTQQELLRTEADGARQREQQLNEQLAVSNGKLATANEELIATNEELSISNEDLAAANEELTTITEELSQSQDKLKTLNAELEDRVKRRTMALAESEHRLRSIINQAPLGIAVLKGPDFVIELANDNILTLWGATQQVIGQPHKVVRPELAGQSLSQILEEVYKTGQPYIGNEAKLQMPGHNKQWGYYNFAYQPLTASANEVTGIMVIVDDVTELVEARQEQLRISEQIKLAKDAARLGMFYRNLQQNTLEWDERARAMFEVKHHNPVTFTDDFLPALHPDDRLRVKNAIANALDKTLTNGDYDAEFRVVDAANNLLRWLKAKGRAFFDENDQPLYLIGSVIDITELVESRRVVEESERRFRFLLDAIPQQVWTANPDGQLSYVNQVVLNDFGQKTATTVSENWQESVHPDDIEHNLEAWQVSLSTAKHYMAEFRLRSKEDEYRWYLSRAVPFMEDGQVSMWIGTNTDITFQKNNEQQKDEFLSIASHELKTPLTSIKAFNQLMQRTKDADKLANFVKKSAEHITRLERLINDLLDVTKINAGKMVYDMQPFNFKQMLQGCVESVQHTSPLYQIVIQQADDVNYTGDRFRIEQVLTNFLTNAIKYSPNADRVIVNSKVEVENIIVSVQDFGIGIAEESLDYLFDRYYRVDNTAMRFEGLGLGLFISSEILKRHHGSFWIESKLGEGSTFYFRLPLTQHIATKPVVQNETFYQDNTITIQCKDACLNANWTGYQDFESVREGCLHMLDIIRQNNCTRILNDNRQVLGTWSDASEWVGEVFFPMMEKAGIQYLAWVFSPSVFSQLSAKKSVDVAVGNIVTQFFTDMHLAEDWVCNRDLPA